MLAFQLALSGIFEMEDDNKWAVYKDIDATKSIQKMIKYTIFGENNAWVFFEILIDSTSLF